MKYEINGHRVETNKALSEAEIDDVAGQLGPAKETASATVPATPSGPSKMDMIKQAAGRVMGTITGPADQFAKPITQGSPVERLMAPMNGLVGPSRLSASISEPGRIAGQGVENAIGPNHPILGKLANLGTSMALDPQTYIGGESVAKGVTNGMTDAARWAGKEAAALGSAVSGVKLQNIKTLFDNPAEVISAISSKKAGAELSVAKQLAGVTRDEEFLISKAADRSIGGARTVGEELRPKLDLVNLPDVKNPPLSQAKTGPVRAVFIGNQEAVGPYPAKGLYNIFGDHPLAGGTVSLEAIKKEGIPVVGKSVAAVPVEAKMSIGELVALKRAAGKLSGEGKGSEATLWAPVAKQATDQLEQKAKAVKDAIDLYAKSKTKESFMRLIPRGVNGKPDFLRTIGALTSGLASSPAAIGLATLGTKAAVTAAAPVAKAVTSRVPRAITSATIRQYLLNQAQHGPAAQ